MTTFTFRPETLDFDIFNMVYFNNEYQLPPQFEADDVIIDVGAHIGSFAFAVLVRGAGQVMSVEAHPENYALARQHLEEYITDNRLDLRWGAVWRSDENDDALHHSHFTQVIDGRLNTGHVTITVVDHGQSIPKLGLDDLIEQYIPQRIRLLKMDCEGSEFPILLTSKRLHRVDEIVGEFHDICADDDRNLNLLELPDYEGYTIDLLASHLESLGFQTEYQRHQRYDCGEWIPIERGYFRARQIDKL